MPSAPALRVITDAEAVESLACDREAWADLWQAIARETSAGHLDESRNDEEVPAETAA
jgi:hypothetical protein